VGERSVDTSNVLTILLAIALVLSLLALARCGLLLRRRSQVAAPPSDPFLAELARELLRSARTNRPVSLAVVALAGGEPLDGERRRELAQVVGRAARAIDSVHEIAADELAVVLTETRAHGAIRAADRIAHALRIAGCSDPRVGIAEAGPGIDGRELFRHAYCAMLAAGTQARPAVLPYALELDSFEWTPDRSGSVL
jgi:hypothetical protein